MKALRSSRAEVRNPLLRVPGVVNQLSALPEGTREALRIILVNLSTDARQRADKAWSTHKAPMAVYWKGVGVYAGHLARAIKQIEQIEQMKQTGGDQH